ncbi:MAG: ATP-binding protein, partial [Candidatus Sericytochromatia bacterium]|nr:ATP-binding protein [Candidatus Tanganyikabacteria bacterium]
MRIFIGREEALEALQSDLLGPSRYTIANLHGIGGVGKTTLKAEVLLRLQEAGARIPVFHADENLARSDLGEFLAALADSLHSPWEGEPADFARIRRARHRLRELKGRLTRERDAALLDRGLKVALSGLARRALLAKAPPDQPSSVVALPGGPVLTATVAMPGALPHGAGGTPAVPGAGETHGLSGGDGSSRLTGLARPGTSASRAVTATLPAAAPA